jgi:flagellin-like protein
LEAAPGLNQEKRGFLSPFREKRRGVSEIIATLLLVGVTVVGGVLAMTLVGTITDDAGAFGNIKAKQDLRLIGYDSRDNEHLAGIEDIHNDKNSPTPFLCTASCASDADNVPSDPTDPGTEYIVIYIHNAGLDDVFLDDFLVSTDNILHEWDGDTAGQILSDDDPPLNYPSAGKYSIVDEDGTDDLEQHSDTVIKGGEVVRVVIKLSGQISDDINIDDTIPITVTTADGGIFQFNIQGGSVE